jgi:thiamine-monophosphate kinase
LRVAGDPVLAADSRFAGVLAAFRTPEPRLKAGRRLGASRHVRAMMDLSDGLSTDLARLCAASGVGALVDSIPIHPGAHRLAEATGDDPERWALDGGEDFELLVTVAKRAFEPLAAWLRAASGTVLLRVGTITAEPGIRRADGTAIPPSGWDHLG